MNIPKPDHDLDTAQPTSEWLELAMWCREQEKCGSDPVDIGFELSQIMGLREREWVLEVAFGNPDPNINDLSPSRFGPMLTIGGFSLAAAGLVSFVALMMSLPAFNLMALSLLACGGGVALGVIGANKWQKQKLDDGKASRQLPTR